MYPSQSLRVDAYQLGEGGGRVKDTLVIPVRDHPRMTKPEMRKCDVCGEEFDMRDLNHAHHHTKEPHEPLKLGA